MKKIRNTILIVLAFVIVSVSSILIIHFWDKIHLSQAFTGETSVYNPDELILNGDREKAPNKENILWLKENIDIAFDSKNEATISTAEEIGKDFYSIVVLESEHYSQSISLNSTVDINNLKAMAKLFKEKGKKVYSAVNLSFKSEDILKLCEFSDGVILLGAEEIKTEKLNSILLKITQTAKLKNLKSDVFVKLDTDFDYSKFNKKSLDGVYFDIDSTEKAKKIALWDKVMKIAGGKIICGFKFKKNTVCDVPLKTFYELRSTESLFARAFSGYSFIKANKDNCFGAVRLYIKSGIATQMAFREISVTGYEEGSVAETTEFDKQIEIYGSNLYPVKINKKSVSLGEMGSKKIALDYTEGENTYTITQGSKKIEYKLNFNFTGDIIQSVLPSGEIHAVPKEEITIMVVAFSGAEITVKLGTQSFRAIPADKYTMGYTVFVSKIKMPDTLEEISSLGMVTVVGTYFQNSVQQKGAMIVPGVVTTTKPVVTDPSQPQSTLAPLVGNYVPDLPSDAYAYTPSVPHTSSAPSTQSTTLPYFTPYTGTQMCIVTSPFADTKPLIDNDDTFVPYYAPLIAGTIDYVTAESEAYNSEDDEIVYFYELSSGRKVKRSDVQLIQKVDMGSNTLKVLSSESSGGTLKISLSSAWRIPYDISYTPQNYFSGYRKLYNVSDFTASEIKITFHHTGDVSGKVDSSGSNVISSAYFSKETDSVTLTMPLKRAGVYYGCSLEYDASGNMVITVHNKPETLIGSVILLDPGHGGKEPGAVGIGSMVLEKDVNYAIAYYTKIALERKGATVYLTRGGDTTMSLEERKQITRNLKPDLFLAIHNNGSENKNNIGTSTYYYKPFSQPLAKNVYESLLSVYKNNIYLGQSGLFSEIADGTIYYPFSVTRVEDCPSILIEVGYMTNDSECYELIKTENQQLFAEAIASGIEKTILNR